ncbi:MAG: clostripain-related cysteine peptidase [bacterium]
MKKSLLAGLALGLAALILAVSCSKKSTDSGEELPAATITVIAPNGGETWTSGQTHSITWTSSNLGGGARIQYNGNWPSGTWETIVDSTADNGSYSWLVTNPSTHAARIRISGVTNPSVSDTSNDNFSIVAAWTVMMYGAGNNNLDVSNNNTSYIIQDVQDMEKVGSQPGMDIIAMVASQRTGGRAKYYRVEYHPNENPDEISSPMLQDLGSKDMSDPATLKDFINFCKANYPANRYLLVIDDHGAGWPGSCTDELNGGGGELTMPELKNAIAQSNLQQVDIVTFHACLMAMVEVGYELRNVASYMTASQFTMPMQNVLGADLWLAWVKDNLGASPSDLAQKIAEKVSQAAQNKQKTCHYAMIDLSQMNNLGARIGTWGNYLVTETGNYWNEVVHAWGQTHFTQYDNPAYVDLREFANKVKLEEHLAQINLIRNGADSVIAAVNAAVPYTNVYVKPGDPNVPRGGLNIHFPYQMQDFDSANYVTNEFRATNWHAFLSTFLRSSGTSGTPGISVNPTSLPFGQVTVGGSSTLQLNVSNTGDANLVVSQVACPQGFSTDFPGTATLGPGEQGQLNVTFSPAAQQAYSGNLQIASNAPTSPTVVPVSGQGVTGQVSCPTQCAQAAAYTVGQTISQCQFSQVGEWHWFRTTLNIGTYRFQLGNFPAGADYDLLTYMQCADAPNNYTECSGQSENPPTEDFQCTVTGGAVQLFIGIRCYQGPVGGYTFIVSQIGFAPEEGTPRIAAQ